MLRLDVAHAELLRPVYRSHLSTRMIDRLAAVAGRPRDPALCRGRRRDGWPGALRRRVPAQRAPWPRRP
ncbi:hypothetical protein [Actinoplanes sp. RD1]|uniref:hypothetical protein n=1 Tax=Actinoplanes sp. RD1 TaxID=3064538 RepID=UPI0027408ED8|nr:hypothetical protein [Actinoplanes sp. RD1]